jgi:hypothetical protein
MPVDFKELPGGKPAGAPGPEKRVKKSHIVDSVSLMGQTVFSLANPAPNPAPKSARDFQNISTGSGRSRVADIGSQHSMPPEGDGFFLGQRSFFRHCTERTGSSEVHKAPQPDWD